MLSKCPNPICCLTTFSVVQAYVLYNLFRRPIISHHLPHFHLCCRTSHYPKSLWRATANSFFPQRFARGSEMSNASCDTGQDMAASPSAVAPIAISVMLIVGVHSLPAQRPPLYPHPSLPPLCLRYRGQHPRHHSHRRQCKCSVGLTANHATRPRNQCLHR